MRDKLFNNNSDISDFRFDESVVAVFDDMVKRSVPGYEDEEKKRCWQPENFYYFGWPIPEA